MKIAVCGKGGSGKSSIVALLASGLQRRGYQVLVVDSDESNPGLYRLLGFEERPLPLLELVGGKKSVFQTFAEGSNSSSVLAQGRFQTRDIPSPYIVERDRLRLVCVGKILQSLEGCACPMGALSREFLKRLLLEKDEIALVDTEAGVEHFGRGVETGVDRVLAVIEPSRDSLELAEQIVILAGQVKIDGTWGILNKVASEEIAQRLRGELEQRGVPVLGSIGYNAEIWQAGFEGRPIPPGPAEHVVEAILERLLH